MVLAALLCIAALAFNHKRVVEEITDSTHRQLQILAKAEAQDIEGRIRNLTTGMLVMASNSALHPELWELERKEAAFPVGSEEVLFESDDRLISSFYRLNGRGIVLSRIPMLEDRIGRDFSRKGGVAAVMQSGEPAISFLMTESGRRALSICVPVLRAEGARRVLQGIYRTILYLDDLNIMLEEISLDGRGHGWLEDEHGTIIAHPGGEWVGSTSEEMRRGGNHLVVHSHIEAHNIDWRLGISLPYEAISEPIRKHATNTVLLALLFFYGGASLFLLSRRKFTLTREKEHLAKVASAAEALKQSEKRYKTLVESSKDAIIIIEAEGPAAGTIVTANRAAAEMHGYAVEELEGLKISELDTPKHAADVENKISRVLSGEMIQTEIEHRRKDGTVFPVEISAWLIELEGKRYIQAVDRDISERRKAEEEKKNLQDRLFQAEKMEALGELAGGVAHDLNNVLSGIVSYPDLLLLNLPEGSALRGPIETIRQSGLKAAAIVNDLLALARGGINSMDIVNLNDVVRQYLETPEHGLVREFCPDAAFDLELASNLSNLRGSMVHLSKIVMNLVANACEAMPEGGTVRIRTENRLLEVDDDDKRAGQWVMLTVADNGVGLTEEELGNIYKPFYTKKSGAGRSGTGLGMTVVFRTVQDHHGFIEVESEKGAGTEFRIYFPAVHEPVPKQPSQLGIENFAGRGEHILVVDDAAGQREIAGAILKKLGYSVATVKSGEEALEYLKEKPADLVLLDMIMDPGMDGLDTYRMICEIHPGQKAIIASGYSETDRVRELQRIGAGAFIHKPYTIEKLGRALKAELHASSKASYD